MKVKKGHEPVFIIKEDIRMEKMTITIETKSNLLIGGTPPNFEIGGIDMYTKKDKQGYPIIPASSFKGALRAMVRDIKDNPEANKIKNSYADYFQKLYEQNLEKMKSLNIDSDRKNKMKKHFEDALKNVSAEYLFGVVGFNHTPKLLFYDFTIEEEIKKQNNTEQFFSIDAKNTIDTKLEDRITANPRVYQAVRPNVKFKGEIIFYQMEELDIKTEEIRQFLETVICQFNHGFYRLGNSKSRGYGLISVEINKMGCSNV